MLLLCVVFGVAGVRFRSGDNSSWRHVARLALKSTVSRRRTFVWGGWFHALRSNDNNYVKTCIIYFMCFFLINWLPLIYGFNWSRFSNVRKCTWAKVFLTCIFSENCQNMYSFFDYIVLCKTKWKFFFFEKLCKYFVIWLMCFISKHKQCVQYQRIFHHEYHVDLQ